LTWYAPFLSRFRASQVEDVDEADALAHLALPHQSGTRILQPGVDFAIE
jgi:hypothetical protein